MILELKNIDKSFGEKEVLKGVSFTAEGGKAFGLTFFLPLSVATCFRNTLQARLSVRSRGGSGWVPHSPPSVQSQPAALHVHPLLLSPRLEIDHDDGSKSLQPL